MTSSNSTLSIPELRAAFDDRLIAPDSADYDQIRQVVRGDIDRRPAVIIRPANTAEVARAVLLAAESGLELAVRCGGHSAVGHSVSDGGIVIDLRNMRDLEIDVEGRTAWARTGLTAGAYTSATGAHGLATGFGDTGSVGIGGITLGGGVGFLSRKYGMTIDSLLAAEIVTANGEVLHVDAESHPDLFWAIRGGGGNFGIVTEFVLRLHPVGPIVLGGMLLYPGTMARDVLRHWRDFMLDAPDEVGSGVALITAPPAEFVPEPARGQPAAGVILLYAGDPEEGARVCRPLLEFGPPAANLVQPMPYVAVQQLIDQGNPPGMHNYWSGDFLAEFPDEAIDCYVDHAQPPVSPLSQMIVVAGGGAIARVDETATAFGNRQAPFNLHHLSMWPPDPDQDAANIAHTRRISTAMKPWSTGHAYLNFLGAEGLDRVENAFEPPVYERLRQVKRTWDPDNVFHNNQNIPPATT